MKTKNLFLLFVATVLSLVGFTPKAHADGPYRIGNLCYYINPYKGTATVTHDIQAEGSHSIIWKRLVYDDNYPGLKEVIIPSSVYFSQDGKTYQVTAIGDNAFNCSDVERVIIPTSVTSIGEGAFFRSKLYKNSDNWFDGGLYVSNCLIEVDEDDVPYGRFTLKSGTRLIADECCGQAGEKKKKLIYIDLSAPTLEYIGKYAFSNCTNITNVSAYLQNNIVYVGDLAFAGCSNLTSVFSMPKVEYIGMRAFKDCSSLKSISLPNNEKFNTIDKYVFQGCSSLESITIPRFITSINSLAFADCTALREITCQSKIVLMGDDPFWHLNRNLITLHIPQHYLTFYKKNWKGFIYEEERFKLGGVYYVLDDEKKIASIDRDKAGMGNYSELDGKRVIIPETVTAYGEKFTVKYMGRVNGGVFGWSPMDSIVIPANLDRITSQAFSNCRNLKYAAFSSSITQIEDKAFNTCYNLENIPGLTDDQRIIKFSNLYWIGDSAFAGCSKLPKLYLSYVSEIGKRAFFNCSSVTEIVLGPYVSKIGAEAFGGCANLQRMTNLAAAPQAFPEKMFGTAIDRSKFTIYVHRAAYEAFKAAEGWKDYNIQIIPEEVQYFTVRLGVNDENAGTVSGAGKFVEGTEVTVTARSKDGYEFVCWSNGEKKSQFTFKLNKHTSLQAQFREEVIHYYYDLNLQSGNPNLGTVIGSRMHNEKGRVVPITAKPAEGCEFQYWTDSKGTYWGKITEWTVTQDETLTAHFRVKPDYDEYMVYVLGTQVTSANANDILGDGVWAYDRATHTLSTMKDAEYNKQNVEFIQDWETGLGALTVVVNHQIKVEVANAEATIRMAMLGHNGMKITGSQNKGIWLTVHDMYPVQMTKTLTLENHVWFSVTFKNNTDFGKERFDKIMLLSGTPALSVNGAWAQFYAFENGKVSNVTDAKLQLVNAEAAGSMDDTYMEIHDLTPLYDVNYKTEEVMDYCLFSGGGSFYEGEQVTLRALPITNYHFVRWSDGTEDNPYTFTMPAHDVLIDPVVEADEIIPSGAIINAYAPVGEGTIGDDFVNSWYETGTEVTITAIPEEGFDFVKWSDGNTDNPRTIVVEPDKHFNLRAEFAQREQFMVTFLDWNDEIWSEQVVLKGEDAQTPDQPYREGYTFDGWDTDFENVTSELIIRAQYHINVFTVRFFDREEQQIGADQLIEYGGAAVAPEAPAVEGYVFTEWDKFYDFVESDLDVYAQYDLESFKMELVAIGNGTLQADIFDLDAIPTGSAVYLYATPENEHYEIESWSDGGEGDVREIIVTGDTAISVTFVKKQYEVTFIGFAGAVIDVVKVPAGDPAPAPEAPFVEGYHFVEWDTNISEVWENLTVTAIYEADPVNQPQNLQVELTDIDGDTKIDFSWDVLEGAAGYMVGLGYADQAQMIPAPTNSLSFLLSALVEEYKILPGTYSIRWFVAGVDAESNPIGDWAEGQSFEITVQGSQTGIDEISQEPKANSQKLLINGKLFILVGDETYDATGRMVK